MPKPSSPHQKGLAEEYSRMSADRSGHLERAYDAAEMTIPSILPRAGTTAQKLPEAYQSVGGSGVVNLSSKTVLALMPPNSPIFRLYPSNDVEEDFNSRKDGGKLKTQIFEQLSKVERDVTTEIEISGDRIPLEEAIQHLYVAGNVLLNVAKEGTRVFHLDRYVIRRNSEGSFLKIIVEEEVDITELPESIRPQVEQKIDLRDTKINKERIKLYTGIKRVGDKVRVHQEVMGMGIPGSHGSYPADTCPWIPLRFARQDGEDYGRSFIEMVAGDLRSLEYLTKAIVEAALAASKVIFLTNPTGSTKTKNLAKARNGQFVPGRADDVSSLSVDKQSDLANAKETAANLEARLNKAFLLNSSVQRNAERVTAEEIRFMARELEAALGGFYSIMAQEFQLPYVRIRLNMLPRGKRIPKKLVRPSIVTGLEALGRGNDLDKLQLFLRTAAETVGAEAVVAELNVNNYLTRTATAVGIDVSDLFKTPQEKAAAQQQQQAQMMMEKLGPNAVNQLGQLAQQQQAPNQ